MWYFCVDKSRPVLTLQGLLVCQNMLACRNILTWPFIRKLLRHFLMVHVLVPLFLHHLGSAFSDFFSIKPQSLKCWSNQPMGFSTQICIKNFNFVKLSSEITGRWLITLKLEQCSYSLFWNPCVHLKQIVRKFVLQIFIEKRYIHVYRTILRKKGCNFNGNAEINNVMNVLLAILLWKFAQCQHYSSILALKNLFGFHICFENI
jgi:hypothetical protein